jgi:serine phosphatase RsbU (regulator of sigma subunit)
MSNPGDARKTIRISLRHAEGAKAAHYLTVVQGVTIQRAVPITTDPLVIGRDESRSFYLADADVSRSHCEVRLAGEVVLVRDLGSTNGTFIDGVRVEGERALSVSAHLQIGRHSLKHELLTPEDVERHRQFASDLERARRYVEALIPAPKEHGVLRAEWFFVPSSILGGDALGYHEVASGGFAIYVLDVCGHGVASAMHSASVLSTLRNQTLANADFDDPSSVLSRLNDAFQMDEHNGMYFSLFYGVVDPERQSLRYSSAGHPPAIVLGRDGSIRCRLAVKNPPIGSVAGRSFASAECAFEKGDRLYVFSDGVYEILDRDGRDRTFDDFERELSTPTASRTSGESQRLYDAARETAGAELLGDDFTMLIVTYA